MGFLKSHLRMLCVLSVVLLGAGIGAARVAAQPTEPVPSETLSGWFHTIWVDDFQQPERSIVRHFITDDAGQEIELDVPEDLLMRRGGIRGLSGRRVTVTLEPPAPQPPGPETVPPAGPKRKVLSVEPETQPAPLPGAYAPSTESGGGGGVHIDAVQTGSKPYATLLCKFSDTGKDPAKTSYFTGLMGSTFPGLDHYWREVSYDQMNLTGTNVYGWYTLPHTRAEYEALTYNRVLDCLAAADSDVYFPDFFGINFMFAQITYGSTAGMGGSGTPYTLDGVTKPYATTQLFGWWTVQKIVAHEMGHSLGLHHTGGPYGDPYDSLWDVMSSGGVGFTDPTYGALANHTIAYGKDVLGWIAPAQKFQAALDAIQTVTLERLALPTDGGAGYRMAVIPIDASRYYTVEARQYAGYDNGVPAEAVVIHRVDTTQPDREARVVDPDNNGNPNDAAAAWIVGETFESEPHNIRVLVDSDTGTGYAVTIATTAIGPFVETNAATDTLNGQATLNGRVNPKGESANAWFEWGTTTAYGNSTTVRSMGNGTATLGMSETLTGLTPGATYHFRAAAQNASGTRYGADRTFTVTAQGPDLYLSQTNGPAQAVSGGLFTTIVTVWNGGTAPTGTFRVGVYLADNPQASGWKRNVGSMLVSAGLQPGAGAMQDVSCAIPADVAPGAYYLVGWADDSSNVIESNESNNTRSDGTIQIVQSDLALTALSGPSTGEAGLTINVTDTVQNTSAYTSPSSFVRFYLSTDATITTADTILGSRTIPSLNPGAGSTSTTTVTIPGATPAGTYYLGGIVDPFNSVGESDENNNARTGNAIQVAAARPDLIVSSVTGPNSARRGDTKSGNVTVTNQGTAPTGAGFTVAIYLSTDNVITSGDIPLTTVGASVLNAGASQTLSWSGQIPTTIAKGTYYIGAIVDSSDVIPEGNENNNAKAGNTISIR